MGNSYFYNIGVDAEVISLLRAYTTEYVDGHNKYFIELPQIALYSQIAKDGEGVSKYLI